MSVRLTRWQQLRTRAFLFAIGVKRHMTLGVRVVLIDGDRILLIRQTYMPGWQFPGGGVEPGEAAEFSAARELEEESGYRVRGSMSLFGLYHNVNSTTNRDHVALYLGREFEQVRAFSANAEIAESGWFPIDALPAACGPGTTQRVQEIFRGAPRQARW
ncbi:MAG TPA: NUDIX domain-containing protein [Devosiaceae bacterium]|nr:NUDIX domain-containing protein [Devosiaceae bacterium]